MLARGEIGFDYLRHFLTVPVGLGDLETRFIVDSGIGLTALRRTVAASAFPIAGDSARAEHRLSLLVLLGEE